MLKQLIEPLLMIGLLSPITTRAEVYNALCHAGQTSSENENSTAEFLNCQIFHSD